MNTSSHISGTAAVANGATAVAGTGSTWKAAAIREGDLFCALGLAVRIVSVASNTSLTLAQAWPGTTLAHGSVYEIRLVDDGVRSLSTLNDVLTKINLVEDFSDEAGAAADLATEKAGISVAAAAEAETQAGIATAKADEASDDAADANTSKLAAAGSATAAGGSATSASAAKVASEAARDLADGYADDADASRLASAGSAIAAAGSATSANTAKVASEAARDLADGYADDADASKIAAAGSATAAAGSATSANSAKVASEAARDLAEDHADDANTSKLAAAASETAAAGSAASASTDADRAEAAATAAEAIADFDPADFATAAQGVKADSAVQPSDTHAASPKTTPVDADEMTLFDSAASFVRKKLTWANLKATLKTYFDTLYQPASQYLTDIAALSRTDSNFIVGNGTTWVAESGSTARTSLGLGTVATLNSGSSAGNVPVLDGSGKLSTGILPAMALTDTYIVASQVAMLALSAEQGDLAIRTDLNKSFVLSTNSPSTLSDWKELLTPTDAVLSVAGLTGAVSASGLRSALNLVIGTDVQAYSGVLTTLAGLSGSNDDILQWKSGAVARRTPTQVTADLIAFAGDSGSGAPKGLVPAAAAGDSAANKFLKASGAWATVSSALVYLGAVTPTAGAASIEFTGFSTDYDEIIIYVEDVFPTATAQMQLLVSTNNGSSYITSGYAHGYTILAGAMANNNGASASTNLLVLSVIGTDGSGASGHIRLNIGATDIFSYTAFLAKGAAPPALAGGGVVLSSARVNAAKIVFNGTTVGGGKALAFGVKNS